jgi:membrane protein YqaA with SNARE-associated domain
MRTGLIRRGRLVADLVTLSTMALAAFSAATLLPGGSEAVFIGLLATGYAHPWALFLVAALANTAGGMTSWWIGRQIARGVDSERGHAWMQRFRLPQDMATRMEQLFARYGWAALLLCWMPVIGDPITLFAGMARYAAWPTAILTGIARTLRYAVIWLGAAGVIAWLT